MPISKEIDKDLSRPSVLVTGTSGGIGSEIVKILSLSGWNVVGTDHPDTKINLEIKNFCSQWIPCNLTSIVKDNSLLNNFIAKVLSAIGPSPLKGIVHNAAIQTLGSFDELSISDWQSTLDVNLLAPILISKSLLPQLQASQGSIVHIGSIHSQLTKPGFTAYATSKAALSGLTKAMAVELGKQVRVNAIEPAAISTPMLEKGFKNNSNLRQQLDSCHPTGSIGSGSDVASAVMFLLDPAQRFLNGSIMNLGGGIHSRLHDPI